MTRASRLQLHRLAIMVFVGWRILQIVHHYRRLLIVRFEAPRWMSITSRSDFLGSALWPSRSRIQARLLMRGDLRLMPSLPSGCRFRGALLFERDRLPQRLAEQPS